MRRRHKIVLSAAVLALITLGGCRVSLAPELRSATDRLQFDLIPLATGEKTPSDYTEAQVEDLRRQVRAFRSVLAETEQ